MVGSNSHIHSNLEGTNTLFSSTMIGVNRLAGTEVASDSHNLNSRTPDSYEIGNNEMIEKTKSNWNWNPYNTHSSQNVQIENRAIKHNHELLNNNGCHPDNLRTPVDCERISPNTLGSVNRSSLDTSDGGVLVGEQQRLHGTTMSPLIETGISGLDMQVPVLNDRNNTNNCSHEATIISGAEGIHHNLGQNVNESKSSQLRVCVNRLKTSDVELMQTSIKTFIEKSPVLANKIGLLKVDDHNVDIKDNDEAIKLQSQVTSTSSSITTANSQRRNDSSMDTFTIMKASEKEASISKRRQPMMSFDDIPPDQICKFIFENKFEEFLSI